MRSCFEFVKGGYAFGENVNNLNSRMLVKKELHQPLAPVKANRWASQLERIRTHASKWRPERPCNVIGTMRRYLTLSLAT